VQKALPLEMAPLVFDTQITSEIRVVSHPRRLKSIMKNITGQSKDRSGYSKAVHWPRFGQALTQLIAYGRRARTAE
jgi:hypothetical protein